MLFLWFDGDGIFLDKETGKKEWAAPYNGKWVINTRCDKMPTLYSLDGKYPVFEEFEFLNRFKPLTERAKNILRDFFLDRVKFYERVASQLPEGKEYKVTFYPCGG